MNWVALTKSPIFASASIMSLDVLYHHVQGKKNHIQGIDHRLEASVPS